MLFGDFFFHFKYIELIDSEQFGKGNDQTILKPQWNLIVLLSEVLARAEIIFRAET